MGSDFGKVVWQDLTVLNASELRDFYSAVVGWQVKEEDMGEYQDYSMMPPGGGPPAAGVCHARGTNANVPPVWLPYVLVEDVAMAAKTAIELGGQVLDGPRPMGAQSFCVIRDPVGACIALIGSAG